MTLVAETRMDLPTSSGTAPRYTLEDGVLGSMLDEYLREVSGADLHALGGGAANRDQGRASQQPVILQSQPSPPEQAVNQSSRQRAVTRPHKLKSASQPDWTHSSGTEDSSPRPRRPAPRKKSRDRRLSSRRTQELQEKNRQAQQRFRQRQRVRPHSLGYSLHIRRRCAKPVWIGLYGCTAYFHPSYVLHSTRLLSHTLCLSPYALPSPRIILIADRKDRATGGLFQAARIARNVGVSTSVSSVVALSSAGEGNRT